MSNWLKHFDQTMLGMLFTDQHLSPSEVVRIAQEERRADSARQCGVDRSKQYRDCLPHTQVVGLR